MVMVKMVDGQVASGNQWLQLAPTASSLLSLERKKVSYFLKFHQYFAQLLLVGIRDTCDV